MMIKKILFILFALPTISLSTNANLKISSSFPGGNIIVEKIEADTVWLKPALSETEGDWFYWYFKIEGISGKTVTFKFTKPNMFTKFGPAYSINNDHTWKWYGENRIRENSFSYHFSEKDTIAFFSMAFPYTQKNLYEYLGMMNNKAMIKIETLCMSQENREIEKLTISESGHNKKHKVLITARHHACEMMASYVLEGMIESILNEKNLSYLRKNVEFIIIPFIDKDGVENGEQGKNRIPRDHNRDYNGTSIYQATKNLREIVSGWSENKLKIAIDLHCPWIKGDYNEYIYIVGKADQNIEKEQLKFSELIEKNNKGELKYYHENFLPYGEAWNTGNNYSKGLSFAGWAGTIEGISLATTIEFPYANISGNQVSKDGARCFGKSLAYSMQEYLELLEQPAE